MSKTNVYVQLEIDHDRGVIYAHLQRDRDVRMFGRQTVLRISGCPTPIPPLGGGGMMDITADSKKCNWESQPMTGGSSPEDDKLPMAFETLKPGQREGDV